jgi:DNA polymerase I
VQVRPDELTFIPQSAANVPPSYFVSINYDGEKKKCFIRLYDPKTHRINLWYDNSNHQPYCFSDLSIEQLQQKAEVAKNPGFDRFERIEKYDALRDERKRITKIVAKDPLTIGGKPVGSIRDAIRAWEADIKYVENFIYDMGLEPGMMYEVKDGRLSQIPYKPSEETAKQIEKILGDESAEYRQLAHEWARLLECPVPSYRRAAIDIEVFQSVASRIPDPRQAEQEVICASVVDSEGLKRVLLLKRKDIEEGVAELPSQTRLEFYETEKELVSALFKVLLDYPVVLTFNGDDFDMRYLWNRAQRLGFPRNRIPIDMGRDWAYLRYGVHIDLYKFFFNRSIQIYAFGQKYRENTLNEVGEALIDQTKIELEETVSEAPYRELAAYCLRDSEIVMKLSQFDDDLVMKLITALSRISYMTMDDASRQGVSNWIRSIMFCHHRKRNHLIPRSDEILELKGGTYTEAIIKGKKYKGAIVVEPKPGVHFNVAVLDFASLYPSIIKIWNLGYETVRCPHDDEACRSNKVPDTPHWVCKKKRGLESLLIGSLRDLRVGWYKPKSKDKSLPRTLQHWYKVVSDALKVVLNASYGVFGADSFALYCPPVAEATASIGRFSISKALHQAQELGIEVFYGDTDSIFLGSQSEELLHKLIDWSKDALAMELEADKNYRYLALSSRKKNYLGVYPDGSVDIKGLTGKKRHIPEFLKHAFTDMVTTLSQVKSPEEFEVARTRIAEIVKTSYLKLRNREFTLEDLAFSIMMSRSPGGYRKTTPQHVKAANLLANSGVEVKAGDLIDFVKVIGDPGVKPVKLARPEEIDVEKYLEIIRSTFGQVLDALGVEFNDLIGVRKLESFFPG